MPSLQMTRREACSDTKFSSPAAGIEHQAEPEASGLTTELLCFSTGCFLFTSLYLLLHMYNYLFKLFYLLTFGRAPASGDLSHLSRWTNSTQPSIFCKHKHLFATVCSIEWTFFRMLATEKLNTKHFKLDLEAFSISDIDFCASAIFLVT